VVVKNKFIDWHILRPPEKQTFNADVYAIFSGLAWAMYTTLTSSK